MIKYRWGIAAMLLWGAAPVVLKGLATQGSGFLLMVVVYALAACITFPWALSAVRQGTTSLSTWFKIAVIGVLLTSCFNLLAALAAPAVRGTTLGAVIALEPLMVALIAALIARKWLSWQTSVALVVSLAGAWLLINASGQADAGQDALWAVCLVVIGALLWSVAVVFAGHVQLSWSPLQTAMIMIFCGSFPFLVLFPFVFLSTEVFLPSSLSTYVGIVFMAVGATVMANLFWLRSIRELGPLPNSLLINLGPLVTFALSATFLGEEWGRWQTLGALLILLGLTLGAYYQHIMTSLKSQV